MSNKSREQIKPLHIGQDFSSTPIRDDLSIVTSLHEKSCPQSSSPTSSI